MFKKLGLVLYFFLSSTFATDPQVVFSEESPFGLIEVVKTSEGDLNICENKDYNQTHSIIRQDDPTYMGAEYASLATASFCFTQNPKDVLLLGLGGGEFLSYFLNYFPDAFIDAVEINPVMIEIVKNFRKIKTDETKVNFIRADAFKYVDDIKNLMI